MNSKLLRILAVSLILIFCVTFGAVSKTQKSSELRFQFGLGGIIGTSNLLSVIESAKMLSSIGTSSGYSFPGMTQAEIDSLNNISATMQRALMVVNILGSMEYGVFARFLWHIMIAEVDLILLPLDGAYNGRLDFLLTANAGIRAPFWIMPYVTAGVNFTFSFYPGEFVKIENWKGNWAATSDFAFRPGVNVRLGLDFKIGKGGMIGVYAQYMIKDFQEFSAWYNYFIDQGFSVTDAAVKIAASQFRCGITGGFYIF